LLGTPDELAGGEQDGVVRPAAVRPDPEGKPTLRLHAEEPDASDEATGERLLQLRVDEIDENPFQPRREFREEEIASLAESLKSHQMLQPILVRKMGDRYQLISGERRLRAAIKAGWTTVPAQLRDADDRLVAELAIVENLQRKDLNAIEKALSFKRYLDEHRCTQEDLAKRLKIDRSTIANLIRLLELPQDVMDCLRNDQLSAGHARALLPLGDEQLQREFCRRILAEGWSVRDTERLVQERILHEDGAPEPSSPLKRKRTKSDQLLSLEQQLRVVLGTKVEIKQTSTGRGRFVIHFANHEEFERLWEAMTDQRSESQRHSA